MKDNGRIGNYEVISPIRTESAQGSITTFYKGKGTESNRLLTFRVTHFLDGCEEGKVQEIRRRYFREAEIGKRLSHRGILSVYDAEEADDRIYLAMEHVEGKSLEQHCHKGSLLPLIKVLDIVAETAGILSYIHTNGVIHSNLKPAHIMLSKDGTVKITGFGLALYSTDPKPRKRLLIGTPNYMSPEQAMGLEIDPRSDIFSLGVIFFQLLTGELPFSGKDLKSLLTQISRKRHPSVRELDPIIPPGVERIVDKALAKHPDKRYQRASEVAKEIGLPEILKSRLSRFLKYERSKNTYNH